MSSPSQTSQMSRSDTGPRNEEDGEQKRLEVFQMILLNKTTIDEIGSEILDNNNSAGDATAASTVLVSGASVLGNDGTATADSPHIVSTAGQFADDTLNDVDTSVVDNPQHPPVADSTSVPANSSVATSTVPHAEPTASVTLLPNAGMILFNETTIDEIGSEILDNNNSAGDATAASTVLVSGASVLGNDGTATADSPHIVSTAGQFADDTLNDVDMAVGDNPQHPPVADSTSVPANSSAATSTVPHAEPTASVTLLPRASGTRSWGTWAVVAVLALLFSSPDLSGISSVAGDYAVAYGSSSLHQYLRHGMHSTLDPILSWVPPRYFMWLPTYVLPPGQISRLPVEFIASLHADYIAEQPVDIIAQLPPESVARLPATLIAQLPLSSLRQLRLGPTRWFGVGVHLCRRLLSTASYSAVSYLPAWIPAPFTGWVLRFSLSVGLTLFCRLIIEQLLVHIFGLLRRSYRRFRRHSRQP